MATIINGDLFESDASIIAHQTNCVTRKPHGISEQIARRWPNANIYAKRHGTTPNTANANDEGVPGTCVLLPTGSAKPRYIAALMAQVCPGNGKNSYWCLRYGKQFDNDTNTVRLRYFEAALRDLATHLITVEVEDKTIAFPYRVGCGLAGGQWDLYEPLIHSFAHMIEDKGWKTFICKQRNCDRG
jgi:O-acetyl-ADP-ribose deacetylase (regulator of RNase III)